MKRTFQIPELNVIELNSDIVTVSCENDTGFVCFFDNGGSSTPCNNDTGLGGI